MGIMPIEKLFPSLPRFIGDFYRYFGFRIGITDRMKKDFKNERTNVR